MHKGNSCSSLFTDTFVGSYHDPGEDGDTTLWKACWNNDADGIAMLFNRAGRLNVNQAERTGMSPLWIACCTGHVDCVDMLLRRAG